MPYASGMTISEAMLITLDILFSLVDLFSTIDGLKADRAYRKNFNK